VEEPEVYAVRLTRGAGFVDASCTFLGPPPNESDEIEVERDRSTIRQAQVTRIEYRTATNLWIDAEELFTEPAEG
jgi:hypothetical protein